MSIDPDAHLMGLARGASGAGAVPLANGDDSRQTRDLLRSPAGKRAAAFATGNLVASFLDNGTPSQQARAAEILTEISQTIQGDTPMAQPQELILPASYTPEPDPAPTDYEIPPDLAALLDEPDDEPDEFENDEPEPAAEVVDNPDGEYEDPGAEVAKLRKQVQAAEKKAAHERNLRVQTARGGWEAEAATVFRLGDVALLEDAEIKAIKADSKRDFMRQARAIADRNKAVALRFQPAAGVPRPAVPPAQVWGAPPASGPAVPMPSVGANERRQPRRPGNLVDLARTWIAPPEGD